ncbi:MAG: hypothetical protein AMJ38_00570 [Dehalococcoidia bacterium DG_22]|nr:MAG: hypothetical protein AMJ38_00570 [Dehalococcoidia bacterium DG_22]
MHGELEAYAEALRSQVRSLVQRGYPLRLCPWHRPNDLAPWLIDRLEVFACALHKLQQDDPLAYHAIRYYDLRRWPNNGQWCRRLGCSYQEARDAAWRGWLAMAARITYEPPPEP